MADKKHLESIADDSLNTFETIARIAEQKLSESSSNANNSFAAINTITADGNKAVKNLNSISDSIRQGYRALQKEPAISRVVAEDDSGEKHTYYISRKDSLTLEGKANLASYNSSIGRLASEPVGEEVKVTIQDQLKTFYIVEKISFKPALSHNQWDSEYSVFQHEELDTLSLDSLRALLEGKDVDMTDELDAILAGKEDSGVIVGLSHETRTAMVLRDQPILDKFQSDIFRLPIDSQLIVLGPPGTGKTTTLIKRLGQKLDVESLEEDERNLAIDAPNGVLHKLSWLVFTPSDLLKHYVKEAFSREQVPASDDHIKTWEAFRTDLARNVLGILKSNSSSGRYIYKPDMVNLNENILHDPREWFDTFEMFHSERLISQLNDGISIAQSASIDSSHELIDKLRQNIDGKAANKIMTVFSSLSLLEKEISSEIKISKDKTDALIKKELLRQFNPNKQFIKELASFLDSLQQLDDEDESESQFDDDASDEQQVSENQTNDQKAAKAYTSCIRSISRYKFLKKSMPKKGRLSQIWQWLDDRIPEDNVLIEVGQGITLQNGVRRFQNASRRFVSEIPLSYNAFRKQKHKLKKYYKKLPDNNRHIDFMELDALVLLMLKNARALLVQNFVSKKIDEPRFYNLARISGQFRNQVLVDEATDFSVLQLSCMENITNLNTKSFFACGDFNQRITGYGIRSSDQLDWISTHIENKVITTVYRQSKKLNEFARELLKALDGDLQTLGKLPVDSVHTGVPPVLLENSSDIESTANWLADRIGDVEKILQQKMPTVAVLVNSEDKVKPMADALNNHLDENNLKAVPCFEGQSLGEGTDVRVFDVKHIKGLEFEAVFFAGVDELLKQQKELFSRYLYVGTTRAATYFGITCDSHLPQELGSLKTMFTDKWN